MQPVLGPVDLGRRHVSRVLAFQLIAVSIVAASPPVAIAQDFLTLGLLPIGQPVPTFQLPPVQGRRLGLSSRDLIGEVSTAVRAERR